MALDPSRTFAIPLALAAPLLAQTADSALDELRSCIPPDAWVRQTMLVDWDGDGDLDALRASFPQESSQPGIPAAEVQLLANDGQAVFDVVQRAALIVADMTLGDLDGDGRVDVLATGGLPSATPGGVWLLRNDGQGGLGAPTLVATAQPYRIEAVDVDRDGDVDVLGRDLAGLVLLRNTGGGVLASTTIGAFPSGSGLAVGDLDGDGDPDVVFGTGTDLRIRFDDGNGGFASELSLGAVDDVLALGDVDGNGFADLVTRQNLTTTFQLNRGSGRFVSAAAPETSGAVDLVDLDADGDLDLVSDHRLYRNEGSASFTLEDHLYPPFLGGGHAASGDLDGDGDVDLLTTTANRLLLQDASGRFRAVDRERIGSGATLADVDGDGDLDAVAQVPGFVASRIALVANDGRGELQITPATLPGRVLGDFDGDGDPDIVVPSSAGTLTLHQNDGRGAFTASGSCAIPRWGIPAIGDVDQDGALDVYVARASSYGCYEGPCYAPDQDGLLLNDGRGCFADASARLPAFSGVGLAAAIGDIDLDGDPDVVTGAPHVLVNQGGGSFATLALSPSAFAESVALGDLNGDLLPDVYLARSGFGGGDRVLFNLGASFAPEQPTAGLGRSVALADLDGDADLDVVEAAVLRTMIRGPSTAFLAVLRNDGGTFTPVAAPRASSTGVAVADLDQDGDADVFDGARVYLNGGFALAHRGPTRIGRPAVLKLSGAVRAPWLLFATTGLAPGRTRFGLRWLDLRTRAARIAGTLDVTGSARPTFAVPPDPALVGATLHWQALIGAPPRWSNRETTTLTTF